MIHLPALISDLAIILAVAGGVTLLFKKIGQPVVLGYLLAGVLVGPEFSFLPTIQESGAIKVWAEIGVVVLLFSLGLEFSFKKLAAVGRGASITAFTEIIFMLALGYIVGQAFGWNTMDSIFLGGILSISSTTIIIKAFDELGLRQRRFVSLVFGVLIVEDLVAILLMVLLSTIAVSKTFEGVQLLTEAARLGFFLTLWFVGGIFIIPWFLGKVRPLMNAETSLVVSLALCFLMVVLATSLGFSPALGAFIMGSILAETPDGEKIEHNLKGVKDLFAAIFFVSIGMLIEVHTLADHWQAVILISLITIFGKLLATSLGAIISGQSFRHAIQSGMSLAQIGEFSFIIATLGLSLNVTSKFLYPIAVAVSAVTTFTTPYMIRYCDKVYEWLDKKMPESWKTRFAGGVAEVPNIQQNQDLKSSALRIFLNSVIVVAISLACARIVEPLIAEKLWQPEASSYVALTLAVLMSLPFLWAIALKRQQWRYGFYNVEELQQFTSRAVLSLIGRSLWSLALLGFIVSLFTSALVSFMWIALLAIAVGLVGYKNFAKIYQGLERRFLSRLNDREIQKLKSAKPKPSLAPWDAHLAEITVHPDSDAVGKDLAELGLREKMGVTIALIERGSRQIMAPRRGTIFMAYDKVFAIGTDEQLTELSKLLVPVKDVAAPSSGNYGLSYVQLTEDSPFVGKTIRESGIREATDGLIVGIERQNNRILNPDSILKLEPQDGLWIVGNQTLVRKLAAN